MQRMPPQAHSSSVALTSLLLLIALMCAGGVRTARADWTRVAGLSGGDLTAMVAVGDTVVVGTYTGWVYRTTDFGDTWIAADQGKVTWAGATWMYAIGSSIYAGFSNSGIFRSPDGGGTWSAVNTNDPVRFTEAFAANDSFFFSAGLGGVARSSDNGLTWTSSCAGMPDSIVLSLLTHNGKVYAGLGNYGVFVSTDNGRTWNEAAMDQDILSISSMVAHGTDLYLTTSLGRPARSTDDGATWTSIDASLPPYSPIWNQGTTATIGWSGNALLLGRSDGIYRTTDNGATWVAASGMPDMLHFVNAFAPVTGGILAATSIGVMRSEEGGAIWENANAGLFATYVDAFAANGDTLFTGAYRSGIYASDDHGVTWSLRNSGVPSVMIEALSVAAGSVFAGMSGAGVYSSADNGRRWTSMSDPRMPKYVSCMTTIGDSELFVGSFDSIVSRASIPFDGWRTCNTGMPMWPRTMHFDGTYLFAASDSGVFRSSDHGTTWTSAGNVGTRYIYAFASQGGNLVCGSYAGAYLSTDEGETWNSVTKGKLTTGVNTVAFAGAYMIIGTSIGVYISADTGGHWTKVNTGLPASTSIVKLLVSGGELFGGTTSGVWHRGVSELSGVREGQIVQPTNAKLLRSYPNPVASTATLDFGLDFPGPAALVVSNSLGEEVRRMSLAHSPADRRSISLDCANLPPGLYTCRLFTGTSVRTGEIVVVR